MDLIFDIMSSRNYLNNKAEIDKNHNVLCAGRDELHDLIDDDKIADFAEKNNLTVVTRDVDFVKRCCKRKVKIAVLRGNFLYFIEDAIQMFGPELQELFS
jgi:rRNA-processing protein FCF1